MSLWDRSTVALRTLESCRPVTLATVGGEDPGFKRWYGEEGGRGEAEDDEGAPGAEDKDDDRPPITADGWVAGLVCWLV